MPSPDAAATRAPRCSGRSVRAVRRWPVLAVPALVVGLVGCSSAASDGAADEIVPVDDVMLDDLPLGDDSSGGEAASAFDPPEPRPAPLSAEEIATFEMPPVPSPEEWTLDDDRSEAILAAAASPDAEILAVAAIDQLPTDEEIASFGDGLRRTENGRLISLDESAGVACANIEMAIWAIDDGEPETASDRLARAVDLVAGSASEGVQTWLPLLEAQLTAEVIDPVVLVGFLEACSVAGYDL